MKKGVGLWSLIVIWAVVVSVFSGAVSAENVSEDLTKSIADAEIQATVSNLSSAELTKSNIALDDELLKLGVRQSTYDPQAAANYADTWWRHPGNPAYHFYHGTDCCPTCPPSYSCDCANFVSQCLIAGGLDLSAAPPSYLDGYGCIPNCDNLHDYLVNYLGAQHEVRRRGEVEPIWFVKGDPAIFGTDSDHWTHAVFAVIGDDYNYARCNAHSNEAYHITIPDFFSANPSFDLCNYYHIPQQPSMPDLIIDDIWIEPAEFGPGDTIKLWQRTKNIGDGDAVGTFRIQRYFDGNPISHVDKNGLAAGASYQSYYSYTWPSDCNSHTVKVVADLYDAITESNDDNNERSESFSAICVNQPPTASASDISGQPSTMYPDTVYSVSAKYYDPDGRDDLKYCYLRLRHPSKTLTMQWVEATGDYWPYAGEEGANYLTITSVTSTQLTNGYRLTWSFRINDNWPETSSSIDFGVYAWDDGDLTSGWNYDNTDASFVVVQPPDVTTNSASSVTTSSATLNGNLDGTGGETCQVWFQYGKTTSYSDFLPSKSKSSTGSFSDVVSGLDDDTIYHFRAVASNSEGTVFGDDKTFKTDKEIYPELCYSPTSHDFGNKCEGDTDVTTFEIWNCGTGTLNYDLSESCSWVGLYLLSGSSTGEHDSIGVDIDTTGLSEGSHTCYVSISSNGGGGTFTVTVNVIPCEAPELCYSPTSHDFGDKCEGDTDVTTFEIWNCGTGTLNYDLSESCSWVGLYLLSGSSTGEHDSIGVDIDTTGLSEGPHSCDVSITSNGGSGTFTVTVNVIPCEEPVLCYSPTSHDFGDKCEGDTDVTTFEIWNCGTGTLDYDLSESCSWVDVHPTSGSSTGEHDTITVDIDTTGLSVGSHTCYISISSNGGSGTFTVTVNVILCPELSYSPTSHNFGDKCEGETDSTTFEIWNSGTGTLTYSLSESCGWVDAYPTSGSSTGEHDTITVGIDTTGLSEGSHTCYISISSNGGSGTFTVTVNVIPCEEPVLSYSPTSHNFGDKCEGETDSTTFEIRNSGTGTLTYSLSESCGWVDVHPTSGSSTGEHDTITVDIDTTGLSEGSHTCYISLSSNGGSGTFTVTVNVVPCEEPVLSYSPTSHDFRDECEGEMDSTTFEIWNPGGGTLTYTLSESCSWVDVHPTSGSSTGEHDTITVDIDTAGLSEGSYSCDISLSSNGGSGTFTVAVNVVPCPIFDTGLGTYPSIFGTHNGTIKPSQTIMVSKMYTYPCAGTGGHTEYVKIWGNGIDVNASWNGYVGDWHNISFSESFTLVKGETYNYTIRTGSYPQIIHEQNYTTLDGSFINCTSFVDANGKKYYDWIPAIRLFLQ